MPEIARLFIALETPDVVCDALAAAQRELQPLAKAVKWVNAANIHLTLKFIGETDAARIPAIAEALATAAKSTAPFQLVVQGAGGFPNVRRPRVLWLGLAGDLVRLSALHGAIEQHIAPLGYPTEDRPFSAHLTLGRISEPQENPSLRAAIESWRSKSFAAAWQVTRVCLYQSDLHSSGAIYTQLAHPTLGA